MSTAHQQPEMVQRIALSQLSASPTQPRKTFEETDLAGLAAGIKEIGIIQPLNVRRLPGLFAAEGGANELYEIIFGERRFRAAIMAGLLEAPCIVREWNDRQVIEAQLIENLQRKDLDLFEESESYHQTLALLNGDGAASYTVETLAVKIGVEVGYIYKRLKLRHLPDKARAAYMAGEIGVDIAVAISRIPIEQMRDEAAAKIIKPDFQKHPLHVKDARELIQREYMRELRRAPFDQEDPTLVPNMGACRTCKHRTGNMVALFGDVQRGDICTFPTCYFWKVDAVWNRATESARAKGKRILSAAESEQLFDEEGKLAWDSAFVRIADQPPVDLCRPTTKRLPTWRDLLRKSPAKVEVCIGRTPRGAVIELALLNDALAAARLSNADLFLPVKSEAPPAIRLKPPAAAQATPEKPVPTQGEFPTAANPEPGPEPEEERQRAARQKTRVDLAVLKQAVGSLVERIANDGEEQIAAFWTALLPLAIAHAGKEGCSFVGDRRSIDPSIFRETPIDAASLLFAEVSLAELPALIAELLLGQYLRYQGGETSPFLAPFLAAYEIDVATIRRNIETAHKDKKSKPATATPEETTKLATATNDSTF